MSYAKRFAAIFLGAWMQLGRAADHVPPDPPQHPMEDMPSRQMTDLMEMNDAGLIGKLMFDQFEYGRSDHGDALQWDGHGWYGNDYDKAWIKSEGQLVHGDAEMRNELLWDHVVVRWWNLQAGIRHDTGAGPARTWAAFGFQGLAPYWFEIEATAYVGEEGRTALRLSSRYELLVTQRLVLQPRLEVNLYGRSDVANGIGSGLSNSELGLRLRYEVRREIAPYVGVGWDQSYGDTATLARAAGRDRSRVQWLAGIRWWF